MPRCVEKAEDKAVDFGDRMMNEFDRAVVIFAKVFSLILLGVALGYAWRMAQGF